MELDFDSFAEVWKRVCETNSPEYAPDYSENRLSETPEPAEEALVGALSALYSLSRIYSSLGMSCAELREAKRNAAKSFSELHTLYFLAFGDCFRPQREAELGGGALAKLRRAYMLEAQLEARLAELISQDEADEYSAAAARAKENRALVKALLSRIFI